MLLSLPASEKHNYYGECWGFWERGDGKFRNWFHNGSMPGTTSMLIRSDNGITWTALFNLRPEVSDAAFKNLDATMWQAIRSSGLPTTKEFRFRRDPASNPAYPTPWPSRPSNS